VQVSVYRHAWRLAAIQNSAARKIDNPVRSQRGTAAVNIQQGGTTSMVYLPQRYSFLFTVSDVDDINQGRVTLNLIYEGTCPKLKAYKVSLEWVFD
jgi:hypothetical protein